MPGNIIEFGAYTGGSSIFMAALSKRLGRASKVFALDTFTGMPASDPLLDMHGAGDFPGNLDELQLLKTKLQLDNLVLIKGLFQDAVRQIPAEERRFCISLSISTYTRRSNFLSLSSRSTWSRELISSSMTRSSVPAWAR